MHANECARAGEEGDEVCEGESRDTSVHIVRYDKSKANNNSASAALRTNTVFVSDTYWI